MRARPIDAVDSLAGTWFGSRLPAAARERLEPHVRVAEYDAGTEILREGEPTRSLGIVRSGRVALRLAGQRAATTAHLALCRVRRSLTSAPCEF